MLWEQERIMGVIKMGVVALTPIMGALKMDVALAALLPAALLRGVLHLVVLLLLLVVQTTVLKLPLVVMQLFQFSLSVDNFFIQTTPKNHYSVSDF
jgi:hypothetical protein